MEPRKKVVQTELEYKSYNVLKEVVKEKGISIRNGVRRAVKDWILREADLDKDPFFDMSYVTEGGVVTNAASVNGALYKDGSGR
jgi:hypothetical protein